MASLRNLGLPGELSNWQHSNHCPSRVGSTCISRRNSVRRRLPGGWSASPLSTGIQPHLVCCSSTTEVLQLVIPNLFQGSVGIYCLYPIPSGLSSLPYFFRGVLENTCFFIHLCFHWYFGALYEWGCAPSLTSRTSSASGYPVYLLPSEGAETAPWRKRWGFLTSGSSWGMSIEEFCYEIVEETHFCSLWHEATEHKTNLFPIEAKQAVWGRTWSRKAWWGCLDLI